MPPRRNVPQGGSMRDPLNDFDWSSLYQNYDNLCPRYDRQSVYLFAVELDRPESDRTLYYQLVNLFSEERRKSIANPIGVYEAMLYWKLYSQRTSAYNMNMWLRENAAKRQVAQEQLVQLLQELPTSLERNSCTILDRIKWLAKFRLPGMTSAGALPVQTTFLHFLYPTVVPIFDKMVLKAIDAWEQGANHKVGVLNEYLPFAWELAEQHAEQISFFTREGPIRVIDMALWVSRGQGAEVRHVSQ